MVDREGHRLTQRRLAVIDIALALFEEQGYEAATVESIADAAGISVRTFYRYFDTKDGVLGTLGNSLVEELIDRSPAHLSVSSLALELAQISDEHLQDRRIELTVRLLREQPELMHKAALWREQWAQQLARGLANQDQRSEPSDEELVVSRFAITAVAIAVDDWLTGAPGSISAHTERILHLLRTRL